jgi:excisionase family DNA binding protein
MPRPSARSYTIATVADELKVSEKTVRRWIRADQLSAWWVGGRGGGRWLITPQALEGARRRRARVSQQRTDRRWMARLSFGASLPPDVTLAPVVDSTRYTYGPPDAPVHRATVRVNFDEYYRFRHPRSTGEKAAIVAELLRRCGLPDDAVVSLRMRFDLDPEDVERVLRDVVRSVRVPQGLDDSPEDLRTQAGSHLRRHGLPALARVRGEDPLRYLRRMVKNFYRSRGRAHKRAAERARKARKAFKALSDLADVQEARDAPLTD